MVFSVCAQQSQAAGEKLTLTVTPPLFQLTIGPGEFWASSVKVVNTNPYELTLYASVMNFEASGEEGKGRFAPVTEKDPEVLANSLAQWIEISQEPIVVPREQSADIPFSVRIPENAPPGGHYAAILVGTQPFGAEEEGTFIQVSSLVSSLLFVRILGEVIEEGDMREFSTENSLYQKPEVVFTLRFENRGNVHLQPQGDIAIYNMWGKQRGKILVNQKSGFGNVLPQSIRKFVFEWKGEQNFFEAGMYKAVATLSYGSEARQNVWSTTYFWVVPLVPTFGILGGFISFILFMAWAIRAYIHRALTLYQRKLGYLEPLSPAGATLSTTNINTKHHEYKHEAPRYKHEVPLILTRSTAKFLRSLVSVLAVLSVFLKKYASFFIFIVILIGGISVLLMYLSAVLIPARTFEIVVPQEASEGTNIFLEDVGKEINGE